MGKRVVLLFRHDDWAAAQLYGIDQRVFDSVLGMARPFVGDLRDDIASYRTQYRSYAIIKREVGRYLRMRAYKRELDPCEPIQLHGHGGRGAGRPVGGRMHRRPEKAKPPQGRLRKDILISANSRTSQRLRGPETLVTHWHTF